MRLFQIYCDCGIVIFWFPGCHPCVAVVGWQYRWSGSPGSNCKQHYICCIRRFIRRWINNLRSYIRRASYHKLHTKLHLNRIDGVLGHYSRLPCEKNNNDCSFSLFNKPCYSRSPPRHKSVSHFKFNFFSRLCEETTRILNSADSVIERYMDG